MLALCGQSEAGNRVAGSFFLNGTLLSAEQLLQQTSFVCGCDDVCGDLTVRELIEDAFVLSQPPWM